MKKKKKRKKKETYRFASAARKGESSARRVSKGAAVIYYPRIKDVGGDDVLKMLEELDTPVAVLQFGNKNYARRESNQWLENER